MSAESIVPASRPKQDEATTLATLKARGVDLTTCRVALLGIRGYYRDTMGKPDANDRGIYDDAIFVVSDHAYAAFNANCDPSFYRAGMASLKPGLNWYQKGNHGISHPDGGYPALRPATPDETVPVTRDNNPTPNLHGTALNIHRGGYTTTASEGCQTVYPDQWQAFLHLVYSEMDRAHISRVPYLLIDNSP